MAKSTGPIVKNILIAARLVNFVLIFDVRLI